MAAKKQRSFLKLTAISVFLIVANSIYLLGFGGASFFYIFNILLHLGLGIFVTLGGSLLLLHAFPEAMKGKGVSLFVVGAILFVVSVVSGIAIIIWGNSSKTALLLHGHIFASFFSVILLLLWMWGSGRLASVSSGVKFGSVIALVAVVVATIIGSEISDAQYAINNPGLLPATLEEEAMGGKDGPFFPSASATSDGKMIPANFFTDSKSCARSGCHPDIYEQWESSAHHFSSFNNQWYRKSIEYMQEITGPEAAKWCSGCHDPALLFSGQMDQMVADFIDKPEAHAGLGCVACHNIVGVQNTMGNGAYVIEYPELHDLLASNNKFIQMVHDFILKIDPEPHKRTFMKPFHTRQTAEFCSSCHKVHLDVPVNNYRWVRGFNTYDNWQASGVSGQGARSFYYPQTPQDCASCHMPEVPSDDAGNVDGKVHNHRFLAANTALPVANKDTLQLALTEAFLKARQLTLDIFAVSESVPITDAGSGNRFGEQGAALATAFAVGEESGFAIGGGRGITGGVSKIVAPLQNGMQVLKRGESVRLDVVVRTRGIGHFFPSGTVDAQEAWLEVKAVDNRGKMIFWSGAVADNGKGPVDPSAHFYRNMMLDARGNLVNKRNAFASRSVLYVNLIPPGAADIGHYRLNIPKDCGDEITVTARLHYRKFNWWHTQWAYAGERDPNQPDYEATRDYDDGNWRFTGNLENVSGKLKEIPVLPIVTMGEDSLTLKVAGSSQALTSAGTNRKADREAWNDYGIGLLLEGDLKGAERAFRQVTELEPEYVDGWINLARIYLREGNLDKAESVLDSADAYDPNFHKNKFFRGLYYKANGDYELALNALKAVADLYPKDRVVQNQIGRIYFLDSQPAVAIPYFENALQIDSEDLMAHYNLMLCYRAVGNMEKSQAHETRYLRYKADESARAISQEYRQNNPHDNNEAQAIHEHQSMDLKRIRP